MPLAPFEIEGKVVESAFRLDFIRFAGVRSWRQLSGRSFGFPINPKPGYIDGSMYLFDVHNPVDVTKIDFGIAEGLILPAKLELAIDFRYEGPEEYGYPEIEFEEQLQIGSLRFLKNLFPEKIGNVDEVIRMVQQHVDLEDYESPVTDEDNMIFRPKAVDLPR